LLVGIPRPTCGICIRFLNENILDESESVTPCPGHCFNIGAGT